MPRTEISAPCTKPYWTISHSVTAFATTCGAGSPHHTPILLGKGQPPVTAGAIRHHWHPATGPCRRSTGKYRIVARRLPPGQAPVKSKALVQPTPSGQARRQNKLARSSTKGRPTTTTGGLNWPHEDRLRASYPGPGQCLPQPIDISSHKKEETSDTGAATKQKPTTTWETNRGETLP